VSSKTVTEYRTLKAAGICTRCGKAAAAPLQRRCQVCIAKDAPTRRVYRARMAEKHTALARARRAAQPEPTGPNTIACCEGQFQPYQVWHDAHGHPVLRMQCCTKLFTLHS
jgi:hypothetical protein